MSLLDGVTATNDPKPRCADCVQYVEDHKLGLNVHIRGLKQPETGCAIAMKCPHCHRIEIAWSSWASKPTDGGTFWVVGIPCYEHTWVNMFVSRSMLPYIGEPVHLGEIPNG